MDRRNRTDEAIHNGSHEEPSAAVNGANSPEGARAGEKDDLSGRTFRAAFWSVAIRASRILRVASIIVLARFLAPDDFGVMGVALTSMAFIDLSTQTGFRIALIQRSGDIRPYLDTAWTLEVVRGLALAGLMVLAAPLLARLFTVPEAEPVLQVMALTLAARGFVNIAIVYFSKELELFRRFIFMTSRIVVAAGVTIVLAVVLKSVWALVYGALAGTAVMLVTSYLLHPYRPRLNLDRAKARELWRFSKWVLGASLLNYLLQHVDRVFIARILDATAMGLYQMAFRLSQYLGSELKYVGNEVALPVYAKLQEDRQRLRRAYLQGLQFTAVLSFPMAAGILAAGSLLVPVVLGPQWQPMVPAMQVLTIAGVQGALEAVGTAQLFTATGQPDLTMKYQMARLAVLLALLYPLTSTLGLVGAALAFTLSGACIAPFTIRMAMRTLGCSAGMQARALLVPGVSAIVMGGVVLAAREAFHAPPTLLGAGSVMGLGVVVYGALLLLGDRIAGGGMTRTLVHRIRPRASRAGPHF